METFFSTVGALAAITAVIASCLGAGRAWQNRRRRWQLDQVLHRLLRLDRRLVALIIEVDQAFGRGVGWLDHDTVPERLGGHLGYLYGLMDELDVSTALLRAMDTSGPVERTRSDLETLTQLMRDAMNAYVVGLWSAYRDSHGAPLEYRHGSGTVVLQAQDVARAIERRRQAELLFRTVLYRLRGEHFWNDYRSEWPIETRPDPDEDTGPVWANEPRPMAFALSVAAATSQA